MGKPLNDIVGTSGPDTIHGPDGIDVMAGADLIEGAGAVVEAGSHERGAASPPGTRPRHDP